MTPLPGLSWRFALALAVLLVGPLAAHLARAQTPASATKSATATTPATPSPRYPSDRFARRAAEYYKAVFGIEDLSVKVAESGEIIRFSWRVLDPDKAKALSDKKVEPSLEDPEAGVSLVVPSMANIGQLRQTQPPEAGKAYWMAFSNVGRRVKHGHRVNVVIGPFRATGLLVD
jgi:hypothetical protein